MSEYKTLKTTKTKLGNEIRLIGNSDFPSNLSVSLVIGVFHGDEPQGKFLIEEYLKKHSSPPTSKSQISVPLGCSHITGLRLTPTMAPPFCRQTSPSARNPLPQGEDISYKKQLIRLGKHLRNNSTKEEIILWQYLKQKQLGVKFRRQQPIDKYIADFVCFEKKIIIELDGGQHNSSLGIQKDKSRDLFFTNNGYKVIRIWNNEINQNIEGVIQKIQSEIECPPLEGADCELRARFGDKMAVPLLASTADPLYASNQAGPKSMISRWGIKDTNNLLFIPCLNPDGMQLGQRTNANGVDLNRNFPTKNWGKNLGDNATCDDEKSAYYGGISAGSEIETQFLIDTIEEFKPKTILTLHAPYKVVNYDGPAKELAERISAIINYPVEASIGYPTPGSFGTYAGVERQISTITLELDEICPVQDLIKPVHEIFDELL